MRKAYALLAVLALSGCERTATGTEGKQQPAVVQGAHMSATVGGEPGIAVVSVRRWVAGLYVARGLTTSNEGVHLIVRRASLALGFQNLTSGTLVQDEYMGSGGEMSFSAGTGYRYLVIAAPSPLGVDDLDHASFTEFVLP